MSLGACRWTARDGPTALLSLAPVGREGLALLLVDLKEGTGFAQLLRLATSTIPPMARLPVSTRLLIISLYTLLSRSIHSQYSNMVPEYVLFDASFEARGMAGTFCTGFWDSQWRYSRDSHVL